jgi:hypothetical protein
MVRLKLTLTSNVLHCDKASCFCHIEAPTVRFLDQLFNCFGGEWFERSPRQVTKNVGCCKILMAKLGTVGRMSVDRKGRALAWGALLVSALALGGCATSIADLPFVGTPVDAPGRPKDAGAYLPVEDLPPNRDEAAIAPEEQAKIKAQLLAARDRQASATAAKDQGAK